MGDEHAEFEGDYARDLIWLLFDMTGGPLPPYLLEIVMRDGKSFYVHDAIVRNPATRAIGLSVYDFRAMAQAHEDELKAKLDKEPAAARGNFLHSDLHPLLSLGRPRCNINDIAYCVEWLSRYWTLDEFIPEKGKRSLGFQTPAG